MTQPATAAVEAREAQPALAPEYFDPTQAARYMNVSARYLQEICLKGDGPPRIALSRKCHRYSRADIDAWMASRAQRG